MTIKICLAGATGAVGRVLAPAILEAEDLALTGAVARRAAGRDIGEVLGGTEIGVAVSAELAPALERRPDVLIDYTHPTAIKAHALAAIAAGVAVVVGTSGLSAADFDEIGAAAAASGVGVVTGNFSITAALMQHFALIAARHVPQWEVVECARAEKPDAPSGTASELAELLGAVRRPAAAIPVDEIYGPAEARGAEIAGTRVHSLRLPGGPAWCEAIFGLPGESLVIRHVDGGNPEIFVEGTLLAARRAPALKGLVRGLDRLLFAT